jgi:uncharacterized protein YdhG (YjbR/CyaY superfamily)
MSGFADLIAAADDSGAAALRELLELVRAEVPNLTEGVSYGVPALLYHGHALIGAAVTARGYSVYPFSGSVVAKVAADLPGYRLTKGSIGFNSHQPIPPEVIVRIVRLRLAEIEGNPDE